MGFSDASWKQRYMTMGDQAEDKFEEVHTKGFVRYGLRRPPIRVDWLPAFIRYTPDYLTSDKLVEVMGIGEDHTLKVKVDKLSALDEWCGHIDTELFVWDSHKKRCTYINVWKLNDYLDICGMDGEFSDGKPYVGLDVNEVDLPWVAA